MPPRRSVATNGQPAAQPGAAVPSFRPVGNEVLVRMYGQGLGDCFLLAFPRAGAGPNTRPVYVVIDCGVIGGTPDGPKRMKKVVNNIRQATQDHIDVLAITHEHWDHLSGF